MEDSLILNDESKEEYTPPKKVKSLILDKDDAWVDVTKALPNDGVMVMIRIVDDSRTYGVYKDDPTYSVAAEDVKIGYYTSTDKGQKWYVAPPHPKYDYSPLSKGCKINESAHVSHWKIATEEDLEDYNNRFDILGTYDNLMIKVDEKNEETVYRALLWGSTFIRDYITTLSNHKDIMDDPNAANTLEEFKILYNTLCDMQCLIDSQTYIENGEEKLLEHDITERQLHNADQSELKS